MNVERIRKLRDILANVPDDRFEIRRWQCDKVGWVPDEIATAVADLHRCGNSACVAGYMALMGDGVSPDSSGRPWFEGVNGVNAVEDYLGISYEVAEALCMGAWNFTGREPYEDEIAARQIWEITGQPVWEKLTRLDAVKVLDAILDGSLK